MTTGGGAQVGEAACVEKGEPLEWAYPCLSYAIDSRGSSWMDFADVEEAVDLAFKAWEDADCGGQQPPNLIFHPLRPSTCKRAEYNCTGNVNTIAFLGSPGTGQAWEDPCRTSDELPYDSNAFAVTVVWHDTSTGEILDADMMINDQLSTRSKAGGPYANCPETGCEGNFADLRSIVTHEAGHFIGIGHCNPIDVDDPNDPCVKATMFSMADRESVNKRTLAEDDINAVCTIYPPGDLDQSCNAAPKGGLQLNCETDADGKAIACSDEVCTTGGGGGCSATGSPAEAPWGAVLTMLIGLTVWRRRRVAIS
jgi:MYXO-CTERM domain-containing protein